MRIAPFRHQKECFERFADKPYGALFMEQGTGKTKVAIDLFCHKVKSNVVRDLLVIAPNGIHENWVTDELPKHCWEDVDYRAFVYHSKKAGTKAHKFALLELDRHEGPKILCMSYNAFMTKEGRKAAKKFAKEPSTVMVVLDESARIKNPGAKRTRSICAFGEHFTHKLILTGTPVANSPFDVYAQLKFLDEQFWKQHGHGTFAAFRTAHGVFQTVENEHTGKRYEICVAHRSLGLLQEQLKPVCFRVTKEDAGLDLPPKLYSKLAFDLESEQAQKYREVRDEFITFLDTQIVTAPLVITRMLRLQQITCGFIIDDDGIEHDLPNPRIKLLAEILEDVTSQAIIWGRFKRDIRAVMDLLGKRAVQYDGDTSSEDRLEARQRFQAGDVQFFVANPAAAGEGLTLHAAKTVVYYSNSFSLTDRLQSEDRAHRIGQKNAVQYIDLIAKGTIDSTIVQALRDKVNLAQQVTGDKVREWI